MAAIPSKNPPKTEVTEAPAPANNPEISPQNPKQESDEKTIERAAKPTGLKPETSFNLKNLFESFEEEVNEEELDRDLPSEEFNEEELKSLWERFLEDLKSENKIPTYNALYNGKIGLKEDFQVMIEFISSSIVHEFENHKERLVSFLRRELNNYSLDITVTISESESENFIKSNSEIFKDMVKQNPIVLKLKNELGLDYNSND
ncbi:MAG: hypothetical protein PHO74_01045 [Weeksellaceae bacterium]|jgi:DNA polymerase-3 subunit gamma/tau|nr:hypothetical protein [Weeksellaceae bacterium]